MKIWFLQLEDIFYIILARDEEWAWWLLRQNGIGQPDGCLVELFDLDLIYPKGQMMKVLDEREWTHHDPLGPGQLDPNHQG